jgi:thiol:disulfide interchange protein DsbA
VNRRAAALLVGAAALLVGLAPANAAEFQEGVHYIELPVPVETRDPAKIEVVEVFSYGCIHCYQLEPALTQWLQTVDDDVDFRRLPLVTQYLLPFANAFYTAETLGVLERVHLPIFAAIHEYQIDMSRPEHVRRLFAREAEVDEEEFLRVYESFGVRSRIRQAEAQGRMYRIRATPSIVVNGRYVTEAGQAGSTQGMLLLVNQLIEKERQAAAR